MKKNNAKISIIISLFIVAILWWVAFSWNESAYQGAILGNYYYVFPIGNILFSINVLHDVSLMLFGAGFIIVSFTVILAILLKWNR